MSLSQAMLQTQALSIEAAGSSALKAGDGILKFVSRSLRGRAVDGSRARPLTSTCAAADSDRAIHVGNTNDSYIKSGRAASLLLQKEHAAACRQRGRWREQKRASVLKTDKEATSRRSCQDMRGFNATIRLY